MTWTTCRTYLYCCVQDHGQDVCAYTKGEASWTLDRIIAPNDEKLLMLHLTHDQKHLIGTFMLGFKVCLWLCVARLMMEIVTRKE